MVTIDQLFQYFVDNNYIGSQKSITAKELASHFGISDDDVEVEMRDIIRDAIDQGYLIGSHNKGFYIIDSLDDIENNLNSLRSRAEKILLRRRNMLNNWNNIQDQNNKTTLQDLEIREIS